MRYYHGRNVYLGTRVPDIRRPGLDHPREVKGICSKILEDYHSKRISYKKAMRRLNLLELVIEKDANFSEEEKKRLRADVDYFRQVLMDAHYRRGFQ
ncbi:MAG: hypothetical protein QXE05_00130 [Nitrososphaeria archaeon]